MVSRRHRWQPVESRCGICQRPLAVVTREGAVSAGAGILPQVPAAVCIACLPLSEGPAVADLKPTAAAQMLQSLEFEISTERAVQFFLDLFGWQPDVIAGCAMRLHADGRPGAAYRLLDDAAAAGAARFFQVEEAALRLLDGETGRAHDLLLATTAGDHPCWHLHRGTLAYSVGRPDAALAHWRQQISDQPAQLLGWQTLGFYLLYQQADLPAAVCHFAKACERFPDYPDFVQQLAVANARLAQTETKDHG